ncbi:ferrous iron transporter B [candidate division WOR-3 bacterium]|uniref:Ferrous iron transporter B n=1 Tax=candidate division WOR-3 bacterium TaxID=2052148 RepID=A0A660SJJ2_UNCW3|nr:MAG: ferrous iron transporter B [candidate division WOR-3 bacterium]
MRKILLVGNPNVGKSVIFSRLTGVYVIASNYPGTTVEYTKGYMHLGDEKIEIIDVPGTYSLDPTSKAEEVAVKMITETEGILIDIIDATNLERNLNLALQLIKLKRPMIIVLNLWDEAGHIGIEIDKNRLELILGIPVVSTCGITGEGIRELVKRIPEAKVSDFEYEKDERWGKIGEIVTKVQKVRHRHHTFLERLGDATIHPLTGIPIAILILLLIFFIIRRIGEGLISYLFDPIFENLWAPLISSLSRSIGPSIFHDILIGKLIEGRIDFVESLGLLTTGLYVPIAMVLPYVFAFYLVLSILEDSGYLPRLGVLVDTIMHRFGIHGLAIVPMLLGLGCNVPGALATRVLETRRERFIAATMMAIAVPCMAQIAMIFGLVGRYGPKALFFVFFSLFVVWLILGILLKTLIRGESPEIFVEIPPYRLPYLKAILTKVEMRIISFLFEAVPWVLIGVIIVNILYVSGVISFLGTILAPLITGLLGLPPEAVAALIIGFLRKDVAVGMLSPLGLSESQLIVASVVLTMYFPCAATFTILLRELGIRDMCRSALIMIITALTIGTILNLIFTVF